MQLWCQLLPLGDIRIRFFQVYNLFWRLPVQVCEGLRGEESMKGELFWRERSAGFVNSTLDTELNSRKQMRKETNMLKCSLTRWHWRHTCLEGLSIEADMPENQTKRRQLRDTDMEVWFERVTETSICHFTSSLSANVDMSDPQSMFYTACAMCKGRQERLEDGRVGCWGVKTDRSTNLSCLLHPQKVGRRLARRKKQRGFIYKSSEDLTEFIASPHKLLLHLIFTWSYFLIKSDAVHEQREIVFNISNDFHRATWNKLRYNLNGRLVSQSVKSDEAAVSPKHQPTVLKGPKTKVLLMVIGDWF